MSKQRKFNRSNEPKKFNLRRDDDKVLNVDPSTIPTVSPITVLDNFGYSQEETPYFKVQEIEYPIIANGYNYTEQFFQSFTEKLNSRPFPGSADGHNMSWGGRSSTDLFLVGFKLESNGDGSGKVYFKNWIPERIGNKDNSAFILENKAGLVDYSLVAWTEDEEVVDDTTGQITMNVIKSIRGERNDAVEYGEGAMLQKTNAQVALDNNNEEEGQKMAKKSEIFAGLKTLKDNLEVTLPEVAKHLGLESLLITDAQKANLANFDEVVKLCGSQPPVEFVKDLIKAKKENAETARENLLEKEFGPKVFKETQKVNSSRKYVENILGDDELNEDRIKELKSDEAYLALKANEADFNSNDNEIGEIVGEKKTNKETSDVAEY